MLCSSIIMVFFFYQYPSLQLMLVYKISDESVEEMTDSTNWDNIKRFNILSEIIACFQGMLFMIGFGFGYSL